MRAKHHSIPFLHPLVVLAVSLLMVVAVPATSLAADITPLPTPPPGSNSYGLEATKPKPPPKYPATITVPGSGAAYTTSPITVSGICKSDDLLVEVYDNGAFAGSTMCKGGSFTVQVTLFTGQNDLTANVYDELDQTGPDSNKVTVSYNNTSFSAFGTLITLTSTYGRRAADPGSELSWPLQLSGGTGPYAFSTDWGDGSQPDLKSQPLAGTVNLTHTYQKAGIYQVTVKVKDVNGVSAFIQLVAVANGQVPVSKTNAPTTKTTIVKQVMWIPLIVMGVLLFPAFWLGRRSQVVTLRNKLQKSMENYKEL